MLSRDVIAAVARGVAETLNRASLDATLAVYDAQGDTGAQLRRAIRYRPTFYVLPETCCDVQVSMRVGGSGGADGSVTGRARAYVTPSDAGFATRFSCAAAGAKLTFQIVLAPPQVLHESRLTPQLLGMAGDAAARLGVLGHAALVDEQG